MGKLYSYLREYKYMVFLCIFLTFMEVVCELSLPILMSRIVDVGIVQQDLGYITIIGISMVCLAILAIVFGVLNAKYSAKVSQIFAANLRQDMFEKIQKYSFSNIDKFSSSSLVTRLTSDVNILQMSLMMGLRILTRAPIMLVSAYVVAVSINFKLSLIIFVAVFFLGIAVYLIMPTAGKLFEKMQTKLDNLNGTVQENLIAIRVVKAFVREDYEKKKFDESNNDLMESAFQAGSLAASMMPFMILILNLTTITVIWFGGTFVGKGSMTTGELMSFISYIMQILMSVMMFSMILVMLTRAKACAVRAIEVLETKPDIDDSVSDNKEFAIKNGRIQFKDVSFKYNLSEDSGDYVLSNINLDIEPGEFVGIIGGTGSGKSSLVNLIPRFYDVTEGEILVDGKNVKDYSQKDLRDSIGMVMQKNNLFSGTIKENILWGNKNATMEEVIKASRDAQAHNFIESFPKGYDTELGQGGVNVSGGQKQRLCIARAMLKKSPILIFDDSTSAVDTATETKIRKAFHNSFKDSTVIIVAQRITSVMEADKIIVLDDGKIMDMGTHEELMQTSAIYKEIYNSQMEGSVA